MSVRFWIKDANALKCPTEMGPAGEQAKETKNAHSPFDYFTLNAHIPQKQRLSINSKTHMTDQDPVSLNTP